MDARCSVTTSDFSIVGPWKKYIENVNSNLKCVTYYDFKFYHDPANSSKITALLKLLLRKKKLGYFKGRHLQTIQVVGEAIAVVDFRRVDMLSRRDHMAMAHAYCRILPK